MVLHATLRDDAGADSGTFAGFTLRLRCDGGGTASAPATGTRGGGRPRHPPLRDRPGVTYHGPGGTVATPPTPPTGGIRPPGSRVNGGAP